MIWTILSITLTCFAVAGAVSDARTKRIPNRLVLAGLAAALLLRAAWGMEPFWHGVAGAALAMAVGFPLFALRALGGGDVKFLIACGAFVGLPLIGWAALYAAAAGGLLAVWVMLRRGVPLVVMSRAADLMRSAVTFGRAGERMTLQDEGAIAVPYGIAIAAGAMVAWFSVAGG
jgi:prepilin peptidase CpaA